MKRVLIVLALAGCYDTGVDLERMTDQVKVEPFEATPYLPRRQGMQVPPAGTVPRGRILDEPALTDGVEDGTYVETIPMPLTRGLYERGRDRYDVFCAPCHGLLGDGVSEVARNMPLRRPPSLVDLLTATHVHAAAPETPPEGAAPAAELPQGVPTQVAPEPRGHRHGPGGVYYTIKHGFGLMPSYANELSVEDRWAVVAYTFVLARSQRARLAELPPDVREEALRALGGAR